MTASPIESYLREFRLALGPLWWLAGRAEREVRDHLMDAAKKGRDAELSQMAAEERAVAKFGSPEELAESLLEDGGLLMSPRLMRLSVPLGIALVAPGLLFVTASVLKFELGVRFLYDVTFRPVFGLHSTPLELLVNAILVFGPVVALGIMAAASMRVGLKQDGDAFQGTIAIRMTKMQIVVATFTVLVLASLAGYLVLENLACWVGETVRC